MLHDQTDVLIICSRQDQEVWVPHLARAKEGGPISTVPATWCRIVPTVGAGSPADRRRVCGICRGMGERNRPASGPRAAER